MCFTCKSHVVTCDPHVNQLCFYHMWITCEVLFQFHMFFFHVVFKGDFRRGGGEGRERGDPQTKA